MKTVLPVATAMLDARAFFARAWPGGWVVATEKNVLVLDVSLNVVGRVDVGAKPEDIALDSTGAILVIATGQTLAAVETKRGRSNWSAHGNFIGCRTIGTSLWAAEGCDDQVEISVRNVVTGEVSRTTRVTDPFRGSSVMLFPHPSDRCTVAWVAAGQDGQAAYLLTDTGTTIEAAELAPRNCLPPVFLPDSRSYLSAGEEILGHYRWPTGERLGAVAWPTATDDQEDPPGGDLQIIPGGYATWSSTNGRIHVADLVEMRIVDELTVGGHPVRTVEELYPTLRGDRAPCTDFGYAEAGPNGLMLTVHASSYLVSTRIRDWSPNPARVMAAVAR